MSIIRPERPTDTPEIRALITAAFKSASYGDGVEADIVDILGEKGQIALSLIAEIDGEIVGYIVFSPVTINGENCAWLGIGPLAVLPSAQNKGIGSALILAGLEQTKQLGSKGCVMVGSHDFYGRFGFQPLAGLHLVGAAAKTFLGISYDTVIPNGEVLFHDAFYSTHA